jgi:predicted GIY-YIG superfamily endonuclease
MPFSVYILKHPDSRQIIYVGCSFKPVRRAYTHACNFLRKYGFVPVFEIVEMFDDYSTALDREWELIQLHKETVEPYQFTKRPMSGRLPKEFYDIKEIIESVHYQSSSVPQFFTYKDVVEKYKISFADLKRLMKAKSIQPHMFGARTSRLSQQQLNELFRA